MRPTILLLALLLALPVAAESAVLVQQQEANFEASAVAGCPDTVFPDPDLGKFFSLELVAQDERVEASMASDCASAEAWAKGTSRFTSHGIAFDLSASTTLEQYGGAYGYAQISVVFEIEETTQVALDFVGTSQNTNPQGLGRVSGGYELRPSVGSPIYGVEGFPLNFEDHFDVELPAGRYSLTGYCNSERTYRDLVGTELFEDGTGTGRVTISVEFTGSDVVSIETPSLGRWKARYAAP